jgi:hypothetical protein
MDWRPIAEARDVRYGTIADLKMRSGRTYRAVYGFRGHCCAWWPMQGQSRRKPIGTYEPVLFAVQAIGNVDGNDWKTAAIQRHARL